MGSGPDPTPWPDRKKETHTHMLEGAAYDLLLH